MRTCDACGFSNAEDGKPCPLCGAREVSTASSATLDTLADAAPAADPRQLAVVGELYGGRYRLDGFLGSGGMGQVYRARDVETGADLALKILQPSLDDDPDRAERFKREIAILSKIQHPAIPKIFDWGTTDRGLYFVSELIEGEDLKRALRRRGPRPARDAADLTATVADALATAHGMGIVHRDVKPNNIMIAADGSVRLLDFGLARATGFEATTLTRTGMIVGTPAYMSPEQFETHYVTERSDIYSLGVVLFEMLTGRLPFAGNTPLAVAILHKTQPPQAPRSVRHDVPVWLERVVLKCLAKDPERRFPTAAALAAELRKDRAAAPKARRLPSGDTVIEDDSDASEWALVLESEREKTGWAVGMALLFRDRYYKLQQIAAGDRGPATWVYRFAAWPQAEVIRKLVDYKLDCAERREPARESLSSRLYHWWTQKQ